MGKEATNAAAVAVAAAAPKLSTWTVLAKDWAMTVLIGFLVVSYWRGTWTLFDLWLCGQDNTARLTGGSTFCFAGIVDEAYEHRKSGWISCGIGFGLTMLGVGLMWTGLWRPTVELEKLSGNQVKVTYFTAVARFFIIYILGMAAVNVWRGVWYLADFYLLPNKLTENEWGLWPLTSFWVSSVVGSTGCFLLMAGPSLLAPPGIFQIDGPGVNPPPVAITVLSSYYSLTLSAGSTPPHVSLPVVIADAILSFVAVPIGVVLYWRGSWLLMDYYLWQFSPEPKDLHLSIAWSFIIGASLLVLTSETVVALVTVQNRIFWALFGRLRTYLLAWGCVNFWRVVWYVWDEFLGGTNLWSAWIAHAGAVTCLTLLGCVSCITAPASTIGVDFVPVPDAAEEPLFSNLPVPADDLYVLGIGRNPCVMDEAMLSATYVKELDLDDEIEMSPIAEDEEATAEDLQIAATAAGGRRRSSIEEGGGARSSLRRSSVMSGGTGRRASYSSVRRASDTSVQRRRSYFEVQRPDLDRRLSAPTSSAIAGSLVAGTDGTFRRRSFQHRSR